MVSKNPLDITMANKGYFQVQTPEGVQLTRDGRFKLDKSGNLLNLEDNPVLLYYKGNIDLINKTIV